MQQKDAFVDALVVGAGFGGLYQLHHLRKLGLSVKVFEAGSDLGGVWHWNAYPGARVDSDVPVYEFSMKELWEDWTWTERFPDRDELRAYFRYADQKLDLSRDIQLNTRVVSARFDPAIDRWTVSTQHNTVVHPRFLVLCTGFASKPYIPDIKGLDTFKGECHHTAGWPQEGIEMKNKRIGVVGTGASGVQIIQTTGPDAAHLTVFQRTPNLALPMCQRKLDRDEQTHMKHGYQDVYRRRRETFGGFLIDFPPTNAVDVAPAARQAFYEKLWASGGPAFWLGNYPDMFTDERVSDEVYAFWRSKVSARIRDPAMQAVLAPATAPHRFGIQRPSLEQRYFEVYNQPNVTLVALGENPIVEAMPAGVRTKDGAVHELDVLVFATGFDAVTGGITQVDIRGTDGVGIKDRWATGISTYLGLASSNYPNMFFVYGPHGPTALCNGPTCVEVQGGWIVDCLKYMKANDFTRIEATKAAERAWANFVRETHSVGFWTQGRSWYTGANIPGKVVETMSFPGGVPLYDRMCRESAEKGYEGFMLSGTEQLKAHF